MFTKLLPDDARRVTICFEGRDLKVLDGLSIAAALLEAGISHFQHTPVTESARAPFCMMGICFDCVLIIDGVPGRQSCMIQVRDGMRIARQTGLTDALSTTYSDPAFQGE